MSDVFSDRLAEWRAYTGSPWGRIRYAVVAETLRREAARLGEGLHVLDVGGGDGIDAVGLAEAGHHVTVLDQSRSWLLEAERRAAASGVHLQVLEGDLTAPPALPPSDLVLCHFVLQYLPETPAHLGTLARLVRPGGTLSIVLPNPSGMVLRQLVTNGPRAAATELAAGSKRAVVFDHLVRKIELDDLEQAVSAAGMTVVRRYGGRVANDLLTDDDLKDDPAYFEELLALEVSLCDREPYLRVGGFYQVVATRT